MGLPTSCVIIYMVSLVKEEASVLYPFGGFASARLPTFESE
jgi:hypothetical protein